MKNNNPQLHTLGCMVCSRSMAKTDLYGEARL